MQKQTKNLIIFAVLISILIAPSFALAAWWNPFSWGFWGNIWNSIFHFQQTAQQGNQDSVVLSDNCSTLVAQTNSLVDAANYCNIDSDCVVSTATTKLCGCYSLLNKTASLEKVKLANDKYTKLNCPIPACAPCAVPQNIQSTLRCVNKKCAEQTLVGNDKDVHGCIGSAGYTWCEVKQKCLRTWEEKCELDIADQNINLKTVTDNDFGIIIKVPMGWTKLQYPSGMQNTTVGFKQDFQKFEIIKQNLPNVSFDSWSKIWLTTQKGVVSSTNINIDGKNAIKVIRDDSSTVNPKAITIFINGGGKSYQLDWSMNENYLNNSQNEINQVLNSIHFTK